MKRLYTILGSIGILVLFSGCVAQHTCSSEEMIGMKEKGFGVDEINKLCVTYTLQKEAVQVVSEVLRNQREKPRQDGNQAAPVPTSNSDQARSYRDMRRAATCATQAGACRLAQPVDGGLPCACPTPYGLISGVTQ